MLVPKSNVEWNKYTDDTCAHIDNRTSERDIEIEAKKKHT